MPTSNQETLGNGCVCETGCESCDRLAEAWEAMKAALEHVTGGHENDCYLPEARAALALADRVSK